METQKMKKILENIKKYAYFLNKLRHNNIEEINTYERKLK